MKINYKTALFCWIVLSLMASFVFAQTDINQISKDDIFKGLVLNDAKNTNAVLNIKNPSAIEIKKEELKVIFIEDCGKIAIDSNGNKKYSLLVGGFCSGTRIKENVIGSRDICSLDNKTGLNTNCISENYIKNVIYENYTYSCFKEFESIKSDELKNIKIQVDKDDISLELCKDNTFGYKLDWIIDITLSDGLNEKNFIKSEWAWWNNSYIYKYPINCTGLSNYVPIAVNGSNGFTIDGAKQLVWSYCSGTGTALYYNSKTDYAVANNTHLLPFDIEFGNGTSNNPTAVWNSPDYSFVIVYHAGEQNHAGLQDGIDVIDSTSYGNNGVLSTASVGNVTSKFGYGFNITDDYITRAMGGATPYSYEIWINNQYTGAENQFIIGSNGDTSRRSYIVETDDLTIRDSGTFNSNAGSFPVGSWRHLILSSNGTMGSYDYVYINGALNGTLTGSATFSYTWFFCGSGGAGYCDVFSLVDEIRISNRTFHNGNYALQTYKNGINAVGYGDLEPLESIINNVPTFINMTLINSTIGHSFNITAYFNDIDGASDITFSNITINSGACNQLINSTAGTSFKVVFNCSGTPLNLASFSILIKDIAMGSATANGSNAYPNNCPSFNPSLNWLRVNYFNTSLSFTMNGTDADSDAVYYYDNTPLFDINITTGYIYDYINDLSEVGDYSIDLTISDGYCNTSQVLTYKIQVVPTPTLSIFDFDLSVQTNVILLFVLVLLYLGLMIIGFTFKNFGFIGFGFFIGIIIGIMFSGLHMFLTLLFIFINITIFYTFAKTNK